MAPARATRPGVTHRQAVGIFWLAVILAGCTPKPPQTGFVQRVLEDCRSGTPNACRLLAALEGQQDAGGADWVHEHRRRQTRVQRDVSAILRGMNEARGVSEQAARPPPDQH